MSFARGDALQAARLVPQARGMPGKATVAMNERAKFVRAWERRREELAGEVNLSELCRELGVSRPTGYRWVRRHQDAGHDAKEERLQDNAPTCAAPRASSVGARARPTAWTPHGAGAKPQINARPPCSGPRIRGCWMPPLERRCPHGRRPSLVSSGRPPCSPATALGRAFPSARCSRSRRSIEASPHGAIP